MPKEQQQDKDVKKPRRKKQTVAVTSFASPTSAYSPNERSRDYSDVVDGLSELLETFSAGSDAPDKARKVTGFLNGRDSNNQKYLDSFMKTVYDANMAFNESHATPTVNDVLQVARYTYIVEDDGSFSTYEDKFFNNDSMEAMLKDENISSQELGAMMAVHMSLFFSKTPNSPVKGMEETFGNINPGTTDGREPLKVFVTVPGHPAAAIAGRDFVKAYETSITGTEASMTYELNEHLNYQEAHEANKQNWNKDLNEYTAAIARDKKLYEEALQRQAAIHAENEKKFADWEKSYNEKYPNDEAIRKEQADKELQKHEEWAKEYRRTNYADRFEELDQRKNNCNDSLKAENDNPIEIPPMPVERNFFRRIWVRLGGSHSAEYKSAENSRNDAIRRKEEQIERIANLQKDIVEIDEQTKQLNEELDAEIKVHHLRTEELIDQLPDPKIIREEETARQRKELLEDPNKAVDKEVLEAKIKYEDCTAVLEPEINRLRKLIDSSDKEFEQRAADNAKKQDAFQSKDKMQQLVEKITANANKVATSLMDKSQARQKNEVNAILNDANTSKFIMNSKIETLGKGSVTALLDLANIRKNIEPDFDFRSKTASGLQASEILMTQDNQFLEKASQQAMEFVNTPGNVKEGANLKKAAKEKFYGLCQEEYLNRKITAKNTFEDTFNMRCTPDNLQLVMNHLSLKKFTDYAVQEIDGQIPSEHKLPKVTPTNVNDMAYLVMSGIKTTMVLQANKKMDVEKNVNVKDAKVNKARNKRLPDSDRSTAKSSEANKSPKTKNIKALPQGPSI